MNSNINAGNTNIYNTNTTNQQNNSQETTSSKSVNKSKKVDQKVQVTEIRKTPIIFKGPNISKQSVKIEFDYVESSFNLSKRLLKLKEDNYHKSTDVYYEEKINLLKEFFSVEKLKLKKISKEKMIVNSENKKSESPKKNRLNVKELKLNVD